MHIRYYGLIVVRSAIHRYDAHKIQPTSVFMCIVGQKSYGKCRMCSGALKHAISACMGRASPPFPLYRDTYIQ